MKQVQSYADTTSDLEADIEAPRSPLIGHEHSMARDQSKPHHAHVETKMQSCMHDYGDGWQCRKCGYALTKHLRARIDHVTRYMTG